MRIAEKPGLRAPLDLSGDELRSRSGPSVRAMLEGGPGFGAAGRWSVYGLNSLGHFAANALGSWMSPFFGAGGGEDPLEGLGRLLAWYGLARGDEAPDPDEPPFQGGMIGYFGYDLAPRLERLPRRARPDSRLDDVFFELYDTVAAVDHDTGRAELIGCDFADEGESAVRRRLDIWRRFLDRRPETSPRPSSLFGPIESNFTRDAYLAAVERALEYIRAGDVFQVNLSQRFSARGEFDPLDLYLRLKTISPAPFSAYLRPIGRDGGRNTILSASPEWFYQTRGDRIVSRPIKGTRPRGISPEEDARLASDLQASAKDRAELTMIVDLERNDLGRVCRYGSVQVTDALLIESYAQVHHLVATIEGRLRPDAGPIDVVRALFPGGSITGAPKIRAMEVIDELEPTRRSAYTGAIGYFGRGGASAFNIAIRTMLVEGDRASYQVGGGIVADSDPAAEYEETLHKGRALREVLEGLERSP